MAQAIGYNAKTSSSELAYLEKWAECFEHRDVFDMEPEHVAAQNLPTMS
jgi:hypothetical protein